MARLSLWLFGPFAATLDAEPIHFAYDKLRGLLAYLAVESQREYPREALAGLLWPERPESAARKSLSQAIFHLRRAIADTDGTFPFLLVARDAIRFNPASNHWLDVAAFDQLAAALLRQPASSPNPGDVDQLEAAVALYRGPFLQSFSIPDSAAFEEWALLQRERLHRQAMDLLCRLATACEAGGQIERALGHSRRQLELDPWREESHQQVMRLLARLGRRSEALAQYGACRRVLAQELGVEPGAETVRLYEQIRDGRMERGRVRVGEWGSAGGGVQESEGARESNSPLARSPTLSLSLSPTPRHNLPADPTPLVGRERELVRLTERCADPACRLLTIVGPGGVGKTRLAIQAAREQVGRFQDGVCFVDLAPVGSPALLAGAILRALAAPPAGAVSEDERLVTYLADKQTLLLLDNFEHLLGDQESEDGDQGTGVRRQGTEDGTELLVTILGRAPEVKLLVTSRERLNLREEWLVPLEGLEVPPGEDGAVSDRPEQAVSLRGAPFAVARHEAKQSPPMQEIASLRPAKPLRDSARNDEQELQNYSATALFLACARRVQPDFAPTADEAGHIVRICRLLEGMPLGIELAAVWAGKLPLATIAGELSDSLDLLMTTFRDVPARHRSMRAAFDHSWRLLSGRERSILRQLSVFRGGFTREAAEAVTGATLGDLACLVDSCWLRAEPAGRYGMHKLIRQFCGERLAAEHEAEVGEIADKVFDRHAAYFAGYFEAQEPDINWRASVMAQIGPEAGNLDAAWWWVIEHGREELAHSMVMWLYHIAMMDGSYSASMQLFEKAAQRLRKVDANHHGRSGQEQARLLLVFLLRCQGAMCLELGLLLHAWTCAAEACAILDRSERSQRRDAQVIYLRGLQAAIRAVRGEFEEALRIRHELLSLLRTADVNVWPYVSEVGTLFMQANMCDSLGFVTCCMGQYDDSQRWLRESLAIRERLGEERMRAVGLRYLASVLSLTGETDEAERMARAGLIFSEAHQDRIGVGQSHATLGEILTTAGRFAEAQLQFSESLVTARESGNHRLLISGLNESGALALACGDVEGAGRFFSESQVSYERLGIVGTLGYAGAAIGLGRVALARGDLVEAESRFRETLAARACTAWEKMDAITGMAEAMARSGDISRAIELLAFVAEHSFASAATRERVGVLLQELAVELPADVFAAAKARGRALRLENIVAELFGMDGMKGTA